MASQLSSARPRPISGTWSCSAEKNSASSVFIRCIAPRCGGSFCRAGSYADGSYAAGSGYGRLRPNFSCGRLRPSFSCAATHSSGDDRRPQRDLAAQHRGRDDLGQLPHLPGAVTAE
jgi:hypothetical protein